jgi:chemotaxis protein histidine kinase CheA
MKVKDALALARRLKPNNEDTFTDEVLVQFLNEIEGRMQTEVLKIAAEDCVQYDAETDSETELIIGPPHDKIYYLYLIAMIDYTNGEFDKYNNDLVTVNQHITEWARWFTRTHRPINPPEERVYISAYGLAVKHGYSGTETEWVQDYLDAVKAANEAALSANEAAQSLPDYVAAAETAQSGAEAAQEAAETAQAGAEAAQEAAETAQTAAENAQAGAEAAQAAAEAAQSKAEPAQAAAEAAQTAAEAAQSKAEPAQAAAEAAQTAAEEAAERAEAAKDGILNLAVTAETLEPGAEATAEKETDNDGNTTIHFGIPRGDKPIRGVDYWTDEDLADMVQAVMDALPDGDEVSY